MSNRTDPLAVSIHGTNPQFLISKIVRQKIHGATYWKEDCFGLTAETLIDKAVDLMCVGGTFGGNRKPVPFICLILKLLQIQPTKEVIVEYIRQDDLKYLRAIAVFYMRLAGSSVDIYSYLEPLLIDYRKLRLLKSDGKCELIRMDEFVDSCLTSEAFLDIDLPSLPSRIVLERSKLILNERMSVLEADAEFDDDELVYADAFAAHSIDISDKDTYLLGGDSVKQKAKYEQAEAEREYAERRRRKMGSERIPKMSDLFTQPYDNVEKHSSSKARAHRRHKDDDDRPTPAAEEDEDNGRNHRHRSKRHRSGSRGQRHRDDEDSRRHDQGSRRRDADDHRSSRRDEDQHHRSSRRDEDEHHRSSRRDEDQHHRSSRRDEDQHHRSSRRDEDEHHRRREGDGRKRDVDGHRRGGRDDDDEHHRRGRRHRSGSGDPQHRSRSNSHRRHTPRLEAPVRHRDRSRDR